MAEENLDDLQRRISEIAAKQRDEMAALGAVTEKTRREMESLQREIKRSSSSLKKVLQKELVDSLDQIAPAAKKAADNIGKLSQGATNLGLGFAKNANQVSGSLEQLNPVIDATTKVISGLVGAVPLLGGVMSAAAQAVGEAGKIIVTELDKTAKVFQDISSVGGLTARGMSGLRDQFVKSGLSLESYRRVVNENSKTMALFRGSVGQGAEDFTTALGQLTQDRTLRNLGFTADTIAEGATAFLEQQVKLGRARNLTEAQLKEGTRAYLDELDQLSRVTGANRRELQKQQLAALSEQRFRAKLNELQSTEQGRQLAKSAQNLQAAIATQAPGISQGFRDIFAAGGAVTTDAAKQLSVLTRGAAQDIITRFQSGAISEQQAFEELARATGEGTKAFEGIAKYKDLGGTIGNFAEASNFARLAGKDISEAFKIAKRDQEENKKGQDALTRGVVDAQVNLEKFNIEINKSITNILPQAGTVVSNFSNIMLEAVEKLSTLAGQGPEAVGQAAKDVTLNAVKAGAAGLIDGLSFGLAGNLDSFKELQASNPAAYGAGQIGSIAVPGLVAAKTAKAALGNVVARKLPDTGTLVSKAKNTLGNLGASIGAGTAGLAATVGAFLSATSSNTGSAGIEQLKKLGIDRVKEGAAAGGPSSQRTVEVAKLLQGMENFKEITGLKDGYNRGPTSLHNTGNAIDFTVQRPPKNAQEGEAMKAQILAAIGGRGRVLNEYLTPAQGGDRHERTTGGHFHVDGYRNGGISTGPSSGYFQKLHGTEAVVPLPDGKTIPVDVQGLFGNFNWAENSQQQMDLMQRQIDRLEQLVDLTERSISNDGASAQVRKLQDLVDLMGDSVNINQKMLRVARN